MTSAYSTQKYPTEASPLRDGLERPSPSKVRQHDVGVRIRSEQQLHRFLAMELGISKIEIGDVRPRSDLVRLTTAVDREAWQHERRHREREGLGARYQRYGDATA